MKPTLLRRYLFLSLLCAACSNTDDVTFADAPEAGTDAPTSTTDGGAGEAGEDGGGAVEGGAVDTGAPDGGELVVDAGRGDVTATADADAGGGRDAANDARVDAGTGTDGAVDAPPTTVDAPSSIDAGTDATGGTDAPATDSGTLAPICPAPSDPKCQVANAADEAIQMQFPQPCSPEGLHKCGGVFRGVVETLPMICYMSRWRLAGYWTAGQWVATYECTASCGSGKLCDP